MKKIITVTVLFVASFLFLTGNMYFEIPQAEAKGACVRKQA